jgi:peptidoglycan/xylan/chitin deacetylase (PgdA/CDA1 family)
MVRSYIGNTRRYLSNLIDNGGAIFLYHRVIDLKNDPQMLAVSPDNFYDHVKYLKENFELLNIEDFYSLLQSRATLPKRSVILTFDDGYADNFYQALPILESLNVQALFYISTSKLNSPFEMWWDDLERIFLTALPLPQQLKLKIESKEYSFLTNTEEDRIKVYHQLHVLLKYCKVDERDQLVSSLSDWASADYHGRQSNLMMTSEEVKNMNSSASAVIGAHTHNHPALSILNYEEQLNEMQQSKAILESIIGKKVVHFSYPFGSRSDYNEDSMRAAKAAGFKMVCANYYDQVHSWTNRFALPRILIRNWTENEFKQNAKRFFKY